jgi:enoyl-CoA hydratase
VTEEPPLLVDRDDGVVTLTINDPPGNRMGIEFMNELEHHVEELAMDRSARAIVITAAGDENFSVGMNLKELPKGVAQMGSIEAVLDCSPSGTFGICVGSS